MSKHRPDKSTFAERVLDGESRIDQFADEVRAWQAGDQKRPLHAALGLDATELTLVARSPDALRYVLHARRFGRPTPTQLESQGRVDAFSMQLAASATDPYLMAEVEGCRDAIERTLATAASGDRERAASHA
jgi:hypothetical protein